MVTAKDFIIGAIYYRNLEETLKNIMGKQYINHSAVKI
jgi:hypothetical protein